MSRHIPTHAGPVGIRALALAAGIALIPLSAHASFTIPLRSGGPIHFAWVGDLNGDGSPDYVIDRNTENPQRIEAYTQNGTFLWEVNFGPNSANQDNISPGSATIDVGHNDGVTVYDVNGDGRAEVIIKIANGVRFGDGTTWSNSSNVAQWIGVLEGSTGRLLNYAAIPNDFLSVGSLSGWLGVGNSGIFFFGQNRNANGSFNQNHYCYTWSGSNLSLKWRKVDNSARGHQMRIVDVNGDGWDDMAHLGFALSGVDGTRLYLLPGVNHGDRYHIADMDPSRPGLEGYGVQQDNPSGLHEYYYNAANGQMYWEHFGAVADVGRGDAGDLDPAWPGWEVFSFDGVFNARNNQTLAAPANSPWPSLRLWWDDDDLADSYNDGKIEKFVPNAGGSGRWVQRLYTITDYASDAVTETRGAPLFYGDILGDWREEVIVRNSASNRLYVLTPPGTSNRRGTLRNDRYYRNCLSIKGYMQSHHVSFYIGAGGGTPTPTPRPRVTPTPTARPRVTPTATPSGNFQLVNVSSGKCLDVWQNGTANGTVVSQYTCGSGNNQRFTTEDMGGGYVRIRSVSANACLDIAGNSTADGAQLQIWGCGSGLNQQFQMVDVGGGQYRLTPRHSGKAIDVSACSTANGAKVQQWAWLDNNCQKFRRQ